MNIVDLVQYSGIKPSVIGENLVYSKEFLLLFRKICTWTPPSLAIDNFWAIANSRISTYSAKEHSKPVHSGRRDRDARPTDAGFSKSSSYSRDRGSRDRGSRSQPRYSASTNAAAYEKLARSESGWSRDETVENDEKAIRKIQAVLNKLSSDNFTALLAELKQLLTEFAPNGVTNNILDRIISTIFSTAVNNQTFCKYYAALCAELTKTLRVVGEAEMFADLEKQALKENKPTPVLVPQFRRRLLEQCQKKFEEKQAWSLERLRSSRQDLKTMDSETGELTEEEYERIKTKKRVLGNVVFIGELFKAGMIGARIINNIITESLKCSVAEDEELESICKLLVTVGPILDSHPEAAIRMNAYFDTLTKISSVNGGLSSRIRFLILDLVDARKAKWPKAQVVVPPTAAPAKTGRESVPAERRSSSNALPPKNVYPSDKSRSSQRGSSDRASHGSKSQEFSRKSCSAASSSNAPSSSSAVKTLDSKASNRFNVLQSDTAAENTAIKPTDDVATVFERCVSALKEYFSTKDSSVCNFYKDSLVLACS